MQAVRSPHPPGTVGVISGDLARFPAFYTSLMNLQVPSGSCWKWVRGNGVALNRNIIVRDMEGEWLWFIDDDHTFEPDVLLRLLNREVDMIQPLVATRKPPFFPYGYRFNGLKYEGVDWKDIPASGICEWDAIGTGGTLIRRKVLDAVGDPWFEEGRTNPEALGEDLWFCRKMRDKGFRCFVDSNTRLGHIATMEIWPQQDNEGQWCIDLDLDGGVRVRTSTSLGRRMYKE